jgi:hypothetical protein
VLVGAFAPDSVRPLVERYLASLPPAARRDSVRDDGQRPPTGVVTRTVRRGVEPQASTQLVFTGPMAYSRTERFALGSLGEVMTIRLRDRVREALGRDVRRAGVDERPTRAVGVVPGRGRLRVRARADRRADRPPCCGDVPR